MNKITKAWLLTGIVIFLNTTPVFAKESPWRLHLPFEKAVIHYNINGSQEGNETLYIRDFGNERVKITKSKGKIMFVTIITDTIEITTHDSIVNIDKDKRTATRITNPQRFMQEEIEKLSSSDRKVVMKNLETIGMNMALQMGGEVKLKAGEHLGHTCDLVTIMGATSCQMSGTPILLKMDSNLMGIKTKTVATKIDKNASIPADIFKLPKDINIAYNKESDDMNHAMVASMIELMKDPDAPKKIEEGIAQNKMEMEEEQQQETQEFENVMDEDARENSDEPDQKQIDEMMQKGMKTFKGLFN
ncbi:MAG: hypothetical protein OEY66_01165 [Gammaproteobacteria bacterium]|nr:hypothetical protein [Gammaproteobacteria bacterium]